MLSILSRTSVDVELTGVHLVAHFTHHKDNGQLTSMSINNNELGTEGAKYIAHALDAQV